MSPESMTCASKCNNTSQFCEVTGGFIRNDIATPGTPESPPSSYLFAVPSVRYDKPRSPSPDRTDLVWTLSCVCRHMARSGYTWRTQRDCLAATQRQDKHTFSQHVFNERSKAIATHPLHCSNVSDLSAWLQPLSHQTSCTPLAQGRSRVPETLVPPHTHP